MAYYLAITRSEGFVDVYNMDEPRIHCVKL